MTIELDTFAQLRAELGLSDPDINMTIDGTAVTKGSGMAGRRKDGSAFFRVDNPAAQARWTAIVRDVVRRHLDMHLADRPRPLAPAGVGVRVLMEFALPRLESTPYPSPRHTKTPDWDKIARCLGDALMIKKAVVGLVYADDSQVDDAHVTKRYVDPGEEPHVRLRVWIGEGDERA